MKVGHVERETGEVTLELESEPMKAVAGGRTLARTHQPLRLIERDHDDVFYFPLADIETSVLRESDHETRCPHKGTARYWHVVIDGQVIENALWTYPEPIDGLESLKDYAAFYADKVTITRPA